MTTDSLYSLTWVISKENKERKAMDGTGRRYHWASEVSLAYKQEIGMNRQEQI